MSQRCPNGQHYQFATWGQFSTPTVCAMGCASGSWFRTSQHSWAKINAKPKTGQEQNIGNLYLVMEMEMPQSLNSTGWCSRKYLNKEKLQICSYSWNDSSDSLESFQMNKSFMNCTLLILQQLFTTINSFTFYKNRAFQRWDECGNVQRGTLLFL